MNWQIFIGRDFNFQIISNWKRACLDTMPAMSGSVLFCASNSLLTDSSIGRGKEGTYQMNRAFNKSWLLAVSTVYSHFKQNGLKELKHKRVLERKVGLRKKYQCNNHRHANPSLAMRKAQQTRRNIRSIITRSPRCWFFLLFENGCVCEFTWTVTITATCK